MPYVEDSNHNPDYLQGKERVKFNFNIPKPTVTVSRTTDVVDSKFNARVYMKDSYNALGTEENYKYSVYVQEGTNAPVYYVDGIPGTPTNVFDIDCSHSIESCNIIVQYEADLTNTGSYTTLKSTHTITINSSISVGVPMIVYDASNDESIRIGFVNAYQINHSTRVDYTIYDDQGNVIKSASEFSPTWGNSGSYDYFDLPSSLDPGYSFESGKIYNIQLQLYGDTGLAGNVSLEYTKG